MLTTSFVDGGPDWIEVGGPDAEGAVAFYGGLLGWEFRSAGPQAGGYGFFELDGDIVAACNPAQETAAWTLYFQSSEAEATARTAEQAGGTVIQPPTRVMEQGTSVVLADQAGVPFGIWEPGRRKGLDRVMTAGSLCWAELYTPDIARAAAFFNSVLGWETAAVTFPGGVYTSLGTAGTGEDGTFGGLVPVADDPVESQSGGRPYWLPYFGADDPDAAVARAVELGGKVRMPAKSIPGVGRLARLEDPHGARFAVLRGEPRQS
ncbi:VOC family protein [Streptomyces thermospinosisporus]|uniref:VOC family protein n=1 Tax=Streptomyces thermospinosisporus TaxID=161482 RepID=A0ABP4JQL7_9ACTN